ncbi:heme-binding protein [Pirellula staleyi DSM 6068]|uniref:Heme-binding protein n=1 Tax=Pirellula staleyi (strain ATCC 27377 / DSM 6068 / ICPB 4128) TaxID=530564 RepID=D2QZX0_PIRSD|nr:HEAT repeat domain-containing protein [Pirellula staleyi]ADB18335.1 heme-binding protein [Pirellula staleyi DSM 6068]
MNGLSPVQKKRSFTFCDLLAATRTRVMVLALLLLVGKASAQDAQWIWSPAHEPGSVPADAVCHFRKTITLESPEQGSVSIAGDDNYELYINGRRVGGGSSTEKLQDFDVTRFLGRGNNVVAVRATNKSGGTAAVVVRVTIKEKEGDWQAFSSDDTWRTSERPLPLWNTTIYNDRSWAPARKLGPLGETAPWDRREDVPVAAVEKSNRFDISDEFEVQQVLDGGATGSLIAMTFNEFGHILASKEGSGLLLIHDSDGDKTPDEIRTCCDDVKNIQGILALNGGVYVTGDGPDGIGLYKLSDKDRDGKFEDVDTLVKFKTEVAEHGPHSIALGPDGFLYVMLGNHTSIEGEFDEESPHKNYYEGDLLTPKYEDPGGHAVGIKAPGGSIIRTDTQGTAVQIVAGGLRNPYDFCFNREGEMFVHDADMESDDGMTWYRPTRLMHVTPGSEFGWRSGWSKWPEYYFDSLPAAIETGRGSPAGIVAYNHFMFPVRYHNCLFSADWSQGRILAITMKKTGAGYTATSEVFLEGNPLNVTDLDVGPDGWLYFCTGGRGTGGGIYRVTWKGSVPKEVVNIGTGMTAVIRQPQLQSAYARQNIAAIKKQLGTAWDTSLAGVAKSPANPPNYRLQALDLMQLYGPAPEETLLVNLSKDPSAVVRSKTVELMGLHPTAAVSERMVELLDDTDRNVRRKACEALTRCKLEPPLEKVLKILKSDDRHEAWAARRLLESMPVDTWRDTVLASDDHRVLVQGGLALLIVDPRKQNAIDVMQKAHKELEAFVSDRDFLDILRLLEVAIHRGGVSADEVPGLRRQLAEEFPAGDPVMNRELIRLLVYLEESTIIDRYLAYLSSDVADVEKLHVAMHLRFLKSGWTPSRRMTLLEYYEDANQRKGGGSYARYIINATRDFTKDLTEEESVAVLAKGAKMPNAALGALYKLPAQLDDTMIDTLESLDKQLEGKTTDSVQRLRVGIVAVMARSADERSMAYLRKVWEADPERRQPVALGLAQQPEGENWSFLVRSLGILEPAAGREICNKLMDVDQAPEEAEPYRQVILLGLKMKEKGSQPAISLLEYWVGEELAAGKEPADQLIAWQEWFKTTYPEQPAAELPKASENSKYTFEELTTYLGGEEFAKASTARGKEIYVRAQCAKCHRYGDEGESIGPDLTKVTNRFTKKELLESIFYPSHVISSQYQSKTILTTDGRTIQGLVAPGAAGETVVLQSTGEKITLAGDEIEAIKPSTVSAMPEGLLNTLELEEIADLMLFLQSGSREQIAREQDNEAPR